MTVGHKLDTTKRPGRIVSVESSRQGVPQAGGGGVLGQEDGLFCKLSFLTMLTRAACFLDDNILTDTFRTSKYSLGVEVLYGTFKKWGYQTLFQEDLVWFDYWGIILTDLELRSKPTVDSGFMAR